MQKGLMDEIKERLEEDVSSGELIAMGYRPATVYKAQRAWRDARQQDSERQDELHDQAEMVASDYGFSDDENVEKTADDSESSGAELEILRIQAGRLEAMIDEFDEIAHENEDLRKQVAVMELEARESAQLRQRTRQLEADRHLSQLARTNLQHQFNDANLLSKDQSKQIAILERQVTGAKSQNATFANENAQLMEQLQNCRQHIERQTTELKGVNPLKVWAGHPCAVCRRPMSGVASRELAASLLRDLGHPACLGKQNSDMGKWLLAGAAAVYGVSKIR